MPKNRHLSLRQLQVLQLRGQGLALDTIAVRLKMGTESVRTHLRRLREKLGLEDLPQMIVYVTNNRANLARDEAMLRCQAAARPARKRRKRKS